MTTKQKDEEQQQQFKAQEIKDPIKIREEYEKSMINYKDIHFDNKQMMTQIQFTISNLFDT